MSGIPIYYQIKKNDYTGYMAKVLPADCAHYNYDMYVGPMELQIHVI